MHIRHSSTNHKLIESSFVSCVAYTILIWSHSEHILEISFLFICDARLRKYQHLSPQHNAFVFSQGSDTFADLFICDSRLHKYNELSPPTILISLCDNCQEAISLETTQAMSPYHPRRVHHRSLFQRKQFYWTHSMVPLRTNLPQKPVPTKAGLLNALDGPTANIGNMLFMTTNNYDAWDKALIKKDFENAWANYILCSEPCITPIME